MSSALRSPMSSRQGCVPFWDWTNCSSSRPGVAIGGDGVGAGVTLTDEPVSEPRFQGRCESAHGRLLAACSRRCAARDNSSGIAERYQ